MEKEFNNDFRLVDTGWDRELDRALQHDRFELRVVTPFITLPATKRLFAQGKPGPIKVITRFNLDDCAAGVSDLAALRRLLKAGAEIRGVRNLHSKLYLFGSSSVIVTSANLTEAALCRNHEFGFAAGDSAIVKRCEQYFGDLWAKAGQNLTFGRLDEWEEKLSNYLASAPRPGTKSGLGDEGVDVGFENAPSTPVSWTTEAGQAFVKFLGEGVNRVPLSCPTMEEITRSGCHWQVAYPASKRPSSVEEGALIFIARLTEAPNDIRVFGRAIAMRHVPGRDDATPADMSLRPWKEKWPRYLRLHHAEFVAGNMENGVSLNELMSTLLANSFASTKRNATRGEGNLDPRNAYRQQAAVRLTGEGRAWLNERLEEAFAMHGMVALADMADLDWPNLPDYAPPKRNKP